MNKLREAAMERERRRREAEGEAVPATPSDANVPMAEHEEEKK